MTTLPHSAEDCDPRRVGDAGEPGDLAGAHGAERSPLLTLIDASGRRWFLLGTMLLTVMALAVWAAHRDPLAISGLFFAIAAILRTVPKIIQERTRILRDIQPHGTRHACDPPGDATDPIKSAPPA